MMEANDCPRAGRLIGGCRFEPRYDKSPADLSRFKNLSASAEVMETLRSVTYVRDVCTRCGATVERKPILATGG